MGTSTMENDPIQRGSRLVQGFQDGHSNLPRSSVSDNREDTAERSVKR